MQFMAVLETTPSLSMGTTMAEIPLEKIKSKAGKELPAVLASIASQFMAKATIISTEMVRLVDPLMRGQT